MFMSSDWEGEWEWWDSVTISAVHPQTVNHLGPVKRGLLVTSDAFPFFHCSITCLKYPARYFWQIFTSLPITVSILDRRNAIGLTDFLQVPPFDRWQVQPQPQHSLTTLPFNCIRSCSEPQSAFQSLHELFLADATAPTCAAPPLKKTAKLLFNRAHLVSVIDWPFSNSLKSDIT